MTRPRAAMSGPRMAHVVDPLMELPPSRPTPCRVKTEPATAMTKPTADQTRPRTKRLRRPAEGFARPAVRAVARPATGGTGDTDTTVRARPDLGGALAQADPALLRVETTDAGTRADDLADHRPPSDTLTAPATHGGTPPRPLSTVTGRSQAWNGPNAPVRRHGRRCAQGTRAPPGFSASRDRATRSLCQRALPHSADNVHVRFSHMCKSCSKV